MPRIRSVKPDFFMDEDTAVLHPDAQLLLIGLWTLADCDGRLEDRTRRIKAQVFPYRDVDLDARLGDLEDARAIVRYEVGGNPCIQVVHFSRDQRPHPKETSFGLPPPPDPLPTTASREVSRQGVDASRRGLVVGGCGSGSGNGSGSGSSCPPVVGPPVADDDLPDATDDAELLESPPRPELRLTPPDAPKAARTRKQADPEPEPKGDPRHAPLMAALGAAYAEVLPGQKWDTAGKMGGREAKAVKDLLAKADADPRTAGEKAPAEVLKRWRHALSDRYTRVRYAHKLVEKWGDYATPRFPNGTAAVGGGGTAANVADMPAHVLRRADTHHDTLLAIGDADIPIP